MFEPLESVILILGVRTIEPNQPTKTGDAQMEFLDTINALGSHIAVRLLVGNFVLIFMAAFAAHAILAIGSFLGRK